jgi:protease-4
MLRQYYNIFLAKVAQGRNLTPNQVAQIASGRIFSGAVAQKNGLVDQLGGIESAIEKAASLAQQATANCNVVYFHLPKTKLEALWQCFGSSLHNKAFSIFAQACPWLHPFQYGPMRPGVKAMLPYVVSVE